VGVASASSDAIQLEGHGLETETPITVRATEGSTLPSPLAADTTYYAIRVDDSRFRVATSAANAAAGVAIDLTASGGEFVVSTGLPFDEILAWADSVIDDECPAHAVPLLTPTPPQIKMVAARLAGAELQRLSGVKSATMAEALAEAKASLAIWAKGIPLRNVAVEAQRTNLAISRTLSGVKEREEIP